MSLRVCRKDTGVGKLIKYRKKFSDNDLKQKRIIRESVLKRYEKIDNDTLIEGFSSLSYEDDYDEDVDDREVGEAEEEDPEEEEEAVELEGGEEKEAPAAAAKESIKGKFTKEQVDKVKLIPSEYLNVPIPPEEKDYHETSFKYIGISIDAIDFIENCLSKCYITDTECKTLSQAMEDSEGFDLPSLPYRAFLSAMVTPMYLVNNDDAEKMAKYSKLAVRHYNKTHDKRYVFKQLVKANMQSACGFLFHITFVAMNAHPPNCLETFQAEVIEELEEDIRILLCRIKPRN